MRTSSKHIAATAVSVATVAAFGAGAFALAQSDASFDPQDFTSAYSKGSNDAEKGYQANPIDADADANRSKDDRNSTDKTDQAERPTQDILSNRPLQDASGTTAYNVTGNAQLGGVSVSNGSGEGNGAGTGAGSGGAVIVNPSSNNSDTNANNGGSNSGGNGNNGGAGDNTGGGDAPTPVKPNATTPDGYDVLPADTTPDKKTPPSAGDLVFRPVNNNDSTIGRVDPEATTVRIAKSLSSDYAIFSGQKLDAWTVFCALDATYSYNGQGYAWACTKDEFPNYAYFRVDSFPSVAPIGAFDITVSYRVNDADTWHTQTISYEAESSCVYIVSSALDENGNPQVLGKSYGTQTCNLLRYTKAYLRSAGYMPYEWSTQIDHMLLGWKEGDEDVGAFYTPEPGRHVITAGDVVKVPEGFSLSTQFYWLNDACQETSDGMNLCYLQRLSSFDAFGSALEWDDDFNATLTVPFGVQAVDIDDGMCPSISRLCLPSTTMVVHLIGSDMTVGDTFSVDPANPYFGTTDDGILTSKDGTEYLGVPANMTELTVPADVTGVQLQERNWLQRIVLEANSDGNLPTVNLSSVSYCNVVIDEADVATFMQEYNAALNAQDGNTISFTSNPDVQLNMSHGMLYSPDDLVFVANTGSNTTRINGPHTIKQGCFEGNTDVSTLVLSDEDAYSLEPGSLADSNVSTIVCYTNEQKATIESQLPETGASDVQVTVAQQSADGFRYYVADQDGTARTTILEAPADLVTFDGFMTAADGNHIDVDAIMGQSFTACQDLQWVTLAESTTFIGSDAFSGCASLQGAFISCPDSVTMEQDAFSDCPSLRYLASRAMWGDFAFTEAPNGNCVLYRPTGSDGTDGYTMNFQYFTVESGVDDYTTIAQADGSYVLYGCADGNPWLALRSASQLSGEIVLPETTAEIFISAFQDAAGGFTINWNDLPDLMFVDGNAFARSSLMGDVYVGTPDIDHVSIASDAFSYCSGITSFASNAPLFDCASWAFSSCTGLTSVKIAGGPDWSGRGFALFASAFYDCTSLETIEFASTEPISLSLTNAGAGFRFDGSGGSDDPFSTAPDERERIHLVVPEGTEQLYLEEWIYSFLGYAGYDEYYTATYNNILAETMREPSPAEVRQATAEGLLDAENRLRQMMGLDLVDTSSFITLEEHDGYVFQITDESVMLVEAPRDATVVDLAAVVGNAYENVTIGENAFASCPGLQRVIVSSVVGGIESNAFANCDGVIVQFTDNECETVLIGSSATNPFRFGANVKLEVPEGAETEYLSTWPMQCVGIVNDWLLSDYFFDIWTGLREQYPDGGPNAEQLNLAVNTPFMEQENYLRGLMGLELIDNIAEISSYIDCSGMIGLGVDSQRYPVVAALSMLDAHNGSVTEALNAAGLVTSRATRENASVSMSVNSNAPQSDDSTPVGSGANKEYADDSSSNDDSDDDIRDDNLTPDVSIDDDLWPDNSMPKDSNPV